MCYIVLDIVCDLFICLFKFGECFLKMFLNIKVYVIVLEIYKCFWVYYLRMLMKV